MLVAVAEGAIAEHRGADPGAQELRLFSIITRFGSPRDVPLEELRLECSFPADAATAELCRAIADGGPLVRIGP
jgi:hypothetical protein